MRSAGRLTRAAGCGHRRGRGRPRRLRKQASVIAAAAVQSANAAPGEKPIVDESVTQALGGGRGIRRTTLGDASGPPPLALHELLKRLGPLQAVDAFAFVSVAGFRTRSCRIAPDSPELGDDQWHRLAAVPPARNARGSSARLESDASRGACPLG